MFLLIIVLILANFYAWPAAVSTVAIIGIVLKVLGAIISAIIKAAT